MDPVFTLQWPEFVIAHRLQKHLPKKEGYSVLIPLSRQEKGIDLAILKKRGGAHKAVTIQIKSSRAYLRPPPKRESTKSFRFYTWFGRFEVSEDADFILLFGMYAPDTGRTRRVTEKWYQDFTLLFTCDEMRAFMVSCLTRLLNPGIVMALAAMAHSNTRLAREFIEPLMHFWIRLSEEPERFQTVFLKLGISHKLESKLTRNDQNDVRQHFHFANPISRSLFDTGLATAPQYSSARLKSF